MKPAPAPARRPPRAARPAPPPLPRYREDIAILTEELDRAFYQIGRRLFMERLEEYRNTPNDQSRVLKMVDDAVKRLASKRALISPRARATHSTRRILATLEQLVLNQAGPEGVTLAEACKAICGQSRYSYQPYTLSMMIRRTQDLHQLTVRKGRVQRNSTLLVELLERRFEEQQQQSTRKLAKKVAKSTVAASAVPIRASWEREAGGRPWA